MQLEVELDDGSIDIFTPTDYHLFDDWLTVKHTEAMRVRAVNLEPKEVPPHFAFVEFNYRERIPPGRIFRARLVKRAPEVQG